MARAMRLWRLRKSWLTVPSRFAWVMLVVRAFEFYHFPSIHVIPMCLKKDT